jgi:hypothetical protein
VPVKFAIVRAEAIAIPLRPARPRSARHGMKPVASGEKIHSSADALEGLAAVIERRAPVFGGR